MRMRTRLDGDQRSAPSPSSHSASFFSQAGSLLSSSLLLLPAWALPPLRSLLSGTSFDLALPPTAASGYVSDEQQAKVGQEEQRLLADGQPMPQQQRVTRSARALHVQHYVLLALVLLGCWLAFLRPDSHASNTALPVQSWRGQEEGETVIVDVAAGFPLVGSWSAASVSSLPSSRLLSVHWADVNNDRSPDLVLLSASAAAEAGQAELSVSQLLNSARAGSGTAVFRTRPDGSLAVCQSRLTLPSHSPLTSSLGVSALLVDVDHDHRVDVLLQLQGGGRSYCEAQLCPLSDNTGGECAAVWTFTAGSVLPASLPSAGQVAAAPLTAGDWNLDRELELLQVAAQPSGSKQSACQIRSRDGRAPLRSFSILPRKRSKDVVSSSFSSCLPGTLQAVKQQAGQQQQQQQQQELDACVSFAMVQLDGSGRPHVLCFGPGFPDSLRVLNWSSAASGLADVTAQWRPAAAGGAERSSYSVAAACVADLNSDGEADYALATQESGLALWLSSPAAGLQYAVSVPQQQPALAASSLACLDADNDADVDVFAVYGRPANNSSGGSHNALFLNDGSGRLRFALSLPDSEAQTVAVADYDNDGGLDLLLASSHSLSLYRNVLQADNHWLELTLYGTRFSASHALGAMVHLLDSDGRTLQSRVAHVASGGLLPFSQHDRRLHFGLGSRSSLPGLRVHWPSTRQHIIYDHPQLDQDWIVLGNGQQPQFLTDGLRATLAGMEFQPGGCPPDRPRLRPAFFILGLWKCGTTSLADSLRDHPDVAHPTMKELFYYYQGMDKLLSRSWYAQQFPCSRGSQLELQPYDATAGYFFEQRNAELITADFPTARFVVLLRDPVERAFSHFSMTVALGNKKVTGNQADRFHTVVLRQLADIQRCVGKAAGIKDEQRIASLGGEELLDPSIVPPAALAGCIGRSGYYLVTGFYFVQLQWWWEALDRNGQSGGRSQLLLLPSELFSAQPDATLRIVHQHLGLQPMNGTFHLSNTREKAPMLPETAALLRRLFRPFNARLKEMRPFGSLPEPAWLQGRQDEQAADATSKT